MNYDLIVFGGGNAITVATECGKAGMKVALVEKGPLGGTCPNRGCIPSKLLIGYADKAEHVRDAGRFHIEAQLGSVDRNALVEETFAYIRKFDGLAQEGMPAGVDLFRVHGTFVDPHTLQVGEERIHAPTVVVATGTRPRRPAFDVPYWTSDDVFSMERVPESITIVGGGYIGCELAHFFDGIGVETLVVDRGGTLLAREDEETCAIFNRAFRVPVRHHTTVDAVSHDGSRFRIRMGEDEHESEALLFAIGRIPNTDRIAIEKSGLVPNEQGFIEADDCMRTSVDGIYALGDVIGRYAFTHAASFEARYLADRIIHERREPIDYGPMPHAVFTSPEMAGVGATEQELKASGEAYVKGTQAYNGVAKGRAIKEDHGLCKFLAKPDGTILGCHIVGYQASVLMHEVLPVMRMDGKIEALAKLIHIHPSLSEVVRGAARRTEARSKPQKVSP